MVTTEIKQRVVAAITERRGNFPSDAKMAVFLSINTAQYSRIMKGELERVLSDSNWISLARKLEVTIGDRMELIPARTPVYNHITAQLEACQKASISSVLCDIADIGKTFTARRYAREHKNAVYIDCSQVNPHCN